MASNAVGSGAMGSNTYDAIVVGTGITGGWAAKELCERGLKTLVLERGRDVRHIEDYPTALKAPWELPYGDELTREEKARFAVQSRSNRVQQSTKHWWVDDLDHPYVEEKPFSWFRGYHVGGRSLLWARLCYRWSDLNFEANAKDGIGVDWPIRYRDLAPWYDHVEEFIGVSGQAEGVAHWPDGKFLPPMEMNCIERSMKEKLKAKYPDRVLTIGRVANLTVPHRGRGKCMHRDACIKGCPYGAYFSSNSSTLPAAAATGNMTLVPNAIVASVIYDDKSGRATGVTVIDTVTKQTTEYFARVLFLNASTLATTGILLNSTSRRFPKGLGNDSGELGHNLMDHHYTGARGRSDELADQYYRGRRPVTLCMPPFRNVTEQRKDYTRVFHCTAGGSRGAWWRTTGQLGLVGPSLKKALSEPGGWGFGIQAYGECLPYHDNRVSLSPDKKDAWGLPQLSIHCEFKENEARMGDDMRASAMEMLEALGMKDIRPREGKTIPGYIIHEMGTARMGKSPKTSVLNGHNQIHAAKNVFVTDGSCMASSASQNPSLTYMALTARAAAFAVSELKRGQL